MGLLSGTPAHPIRSFVLARVAEWQTRRTQNPLFVRTCGFDSHLGHQVINTLSPMGQRLLERKLRQTSDKLREARLELLVVQDQLAALVDDADDLAVRALVSETPAAGFEHRDAQAHVDVMVVHRGRLVAVVTELEITIDRLLDQMKDITE